MMSSDSSEFFSASRVQNCAEKAGFEIVETAQVPGHEPRYLPVPSRLDSSIRDFLISQYSEGLWAHQAEAIDAVLDGRDICLATSTASGKSLVFMTVAAELLLKDSSARVLALYPARALIQDQVEKWQTMLVIHCCPVKTRAESTGWDFRLNRLGSPTLPRPVKWALFQKA